MKFSFFVAVLACVIPSGFAAAQSDKDVLSAYQSKDISEAQFRILINEISPMANEEKWRETAWIPGILEGITLAQQKQKPIFLWAMNGDPLGCV